MLHLTTDDGYLVSFFTFFFIGDADTGQRLVPTASPERDSLIGHFDFVSYLCTRDRSQRRLYIGVNVHGDRTSVELGRAEMSNNEANGTVVQRFKEEEMPPQEEGGSKEVNW